MFLAKNRGIDDTVKSQHISFSWCYRNRTNHIEHMDLRRTSENPPKNEINISFDINRSIPRNAFICCFFCLMCIYLSFPKHITNMVTQMPNNNLCNGRQLLFIVCRAAELNVCVCVCFGWFRVSHSYSFFRRFNFVNVFENRSCHAICIPMAKIYNHNWISIYVNLCN